MLDAKHRGERQFQPPSREALGQAQTVRGVGERDVEGVRRQPRHELERIRAMHSRRGWWFLLGINLNGSLQQRLDALDVAYKRHDLAGCSYVDLRPMPNIYCTNDPAWRRPLGPGS